MSDHESLTDVLFKLFAFHQFLAAYKKHKRTVWRTQHTVDFIDSDIAVLSGFLCRECHFQVDRHLADGIFIWLPPSIRIVVRQDVYKRQSPGRGDHLHPKPGDGTALSAGGAQPIGSAEQISVCDSDQ